MTPPVRVTIVIPTYNERENLRPLIEQISAAFSSWRHATPSRSPSGRGGEIEVDVLLVDDNSPDGTGELAEELAWEYAPSPSRSPSQGEGEKEKNNFPTSSQEGGRGGVAIRVLHRPRKEGLGAALIAGFQEALNSSAYLSSGRGKDMLMPRTGDNVIIQMDADGSHDPEEIPAMLARIRDGADVVVGSRCVPGGRIIGWGLHRRAMSASAQWFARRALGFHTRDVTSGFRAWRTDALARALAATPMYGS